LKTPPPAAVPGPQPGFGAPAYAAVACCVKKAPANKIPPFMAANTGREGLGAVLVFQQFLVEGLILGAL